MTDTTKTEALEWADLAALGSIADHECADLEKFLRRIDADNAELKDSLFERALRIRTLEDERDRLAAECEALRAAAGLATVALKSCDWCGSAGLEAQCFDEDKVFAAISAIDAAIGGKE